MPPADHPRDALRAARELAHAASQLASEAATLARLFESMGAVEASVAASQACIEAAQAAFALDEQVLRDGHGGPDLKEAVVTALRSLEAASVAVTSAKRALGVVEASSAGSRGAA